MPISQTQIIRSLGEALAWFEKEIEWGVPPQNLNHLTARIGELYAAMVTRGQMALAVNQRGYDVVSAEKERISVKTVTTSNHVDINKNTFDVVDRVMVLRLNTDDDDISIEEIIDVPAADIIPMCRLKENAYSFPIRRRQPDKPRSDEKVVRQGTLGDTSVLEYESGAIEVQKDGVPVPVTKPALREVAAQLGVGLLNGNGNPRNTRQLGAEVIAALAALHGEDPLHDDGHFEEVQPDIPVSGEKVVREAVLGDTRVLEYESGTIEVQEDGVRVPVMKPVLRKLADQLGVSLLNGNGNFRNTRQLGAEVIAAIAAHYRKTSSGA
ncbi:hypothetical protein ACTVH1_17335 [Gluconobacter cerinus]